MLNESISLPFLMPKVYGGLGQGSGILRAWQEALILEFQVKDAIFKAFELAAKEIRIPLGEIAAIDFRKGWFSARITIRANNLKTLQKVPGSEAGEIQLIIGRKDIVQAREFVSHISLALTARDLKKMAEETSAFGSRRME